MRTVHDVIHLKLTIVICDCTVSVSASLFLSSSPESDLTWRILATWGIFGSTNPCLFADCCAGRDPAEGCGCTNGRNLGHRVQNLYQKKISMGFCICSTLSQPLCCQCWTIHADDHWKCENRNHSASLPFLPLPCVSSGSAAGKSAWLGVVLSDPENGHYFFWKHSQESLQCSSESQIDTLVLMGGSAVISHFPRDHPDFLAPEEFLYFM